MFNQKSFQTFLTANKNSMFLMWFFITVCGILENTKCTGMENVRELFHYCFYRRKVFTPLKKSVSPRNIYIPVQMKVLKVCSRSLENYCQCSLACLKNALNVSHFKYQRFCCNSPVNFIFKSMLFFFGSVLYEV